MVSSGILHFLKIGSANKDLVIIGFVDSLNVDRVLLISYIRYIGSSTKTISSQQTAC